MFNIQIRPGDDFIKNFELGNQFFTDIINKTNTGMERMGIFHSIDENGYFEAFARMHR